MVDPNPARGMPLQLQRFWLVGKGAAKIRWNIPGDFMRCVRQLRKHFPKNPEGLCNILHTKATGGPPGHGSMEKHAPSITAASVVLPANTGKRTGAVPQASLEEARALLAAMPMLGEHLWAGPIAVYNRSTEEPHQSRIFEHGSLRHRPLPLPLRYQKVALPGHQGAVTVGRILGTTTGPDEHGMETEYAWGDWLDEDIVPEVKEAKYMVQQGVAGASIDPGGRVVATQNPETGAHHTSLYTYGGATLVSIPAYSATRLYNLTDGAWPDDDPDMDVAYELDDDDCGCGSGVPEVASGGAVRQPATYAVNTSGWRGLPLAAREATFDNDDAVKRITAWANGGQDVDKLNQAFMWRDESKPPTDPTSYRLPVGDVINGRLTLIFHAIYAAAALLSGAHGGLPDIPDQDKSELRTVISEIYPEMAEAFNDSSIAAPWDRPASVQAREDAGIQGKEFAMADDAKEPYGDVKYADPGYQKDGKKRYPIDTEEHIRAAWSYINQQKNASQYTPEQIKAIKSKIQAAMKKIGAEMSDSDNDYSIATTYPLEPPASWFDDPQLQRKTPLTVDPDGHVYGHLAAWGECHRDVSQRSCVLAPRSRKGYTPFHLGHVYTAEGDRLDVGKIVMDTRHADINLGYTAAAFHYDHTGDEVAVVRAGEDDFGIWVAGSMVPEASPAKAAKLRRSPLSGDWRSVEGNLELTAALAVNVPAFPVYAMEGEDQLSLVAAGQVWQAYEDPQDGTETEDLDEYEAQVERAWEFRILEEEDDILSQWERAREFAAIFAADGEPAPAVAEEDPVYGPAAVAAREMDAQYTILEDPEGGGEEDGDEPEPSPDPGGAVVPVGATAPAGAQ